MVDLSLPWLITRNGWLTEGKYAHMQVFHLVNPMIYFIPICLGWWWNDPQKNRGLPGLPGWFVALGWLPGKSVNYPQENPGESQFLPAISGEALKQVWPTGESFGNQRWCAGNFSFRWIVHMFPLKCPSGYIEDFPAMFDDTKGFFISHYSTCYQPWASIDQLVGGLELFLFFHILGIITPTD